MTDPAGRNHPGHPRSPRRVPPTVLWRQAVTPHPYDRDVPINVTPVAHGASAFDALAGAVRAAKGDDPLVPVTIVVPTNTAGVMARRALGRRGGATAIDVLTLYRVAEVLGSAALLDEDRKPVSTPVVDLAIKRVLQTSPGVYAAVADHPSTVVALRDLYREIRLAGPTATGALARTGRGREPARVAAAVAGLLAPNWYDEGDLLVRAAVRARTGLPGRLSRVVVHLPERLRPLEIDLLRALGERGAVELLVGLTGVPAADAAVVDQVQELTGRVLVAPSGSADPGRVDVVSTTDADDEVRAAVRSVLDAARAGVPFDRMAVLWPTDRPYARLVQHHLTAAELPWNGRPGTGTDERAVPRVLAELLELDRRGLRRSDLMALLGDIPARGADGRRVPSARWERIGRRAGIVREEDWDARLPAFISEARERGSSAADDGAALLAFVGDLRDRLGDRGATRPWREWVDWAHAQLERWFGVAMLARLADDEHEAYARTQKVLDRLRHLDSIGPPVDRAEFRATFVAELEVTPARRGTVGDGVHVGLLAGARGLDVDLVVVLGAVEGLLPPPPAVDPLLGDDDRETAGLIGSTERAAAAHRQFLAVVTTTPRVLITVPRGDLRATTEYHPSRWLAAAGAPRDGPAPVRMIDSHVHGLASTEFPMSPTEHRVRELWTRCRAGGDIRDHPLVGGDEVLARAVRLRDARASDAFTEYDGDLSTCTISPIDAPIAPTRIEAWPACPHAYFVRYLLGVRPVDEPEDIVSVTALDRGSALHAAVHRLHQAVLDGDAPAPGPAGWAPAHVELLARLGAEVADELETAGRTGRRAFWAVERPALLGELARWIEADRANWEGRTILLSEASFGREQPVTLALDGGRTVAFEGQIDRVDELPDGTLVVTDHKTGRAHDYTKLADDDPTLGGTRFQLPVYAAAARVLLDRPDARVRAEYAFFEKERFRRICITLDDRAWARVGEELTRVLDGIEAGVFPAIPDPPGYQHFVRCKYCQPDSLGTGERWPEWERKRHDERLARWFVPEATERQ
jgi:ATP-dependent helicase/nuclease subunit B